MITFPNAKINLGLNITEKRLDGFHNIETCMYPVGLSDILEITSAEHDSFRQSGLNIPGNASDNLCQKAIKLLRRDFKFDPVLIHLHKITPFGAGLGGGSSDGAFTIKMINEIFDLKISIAKMKEYAEQLGSDCPFFINNKVAIASGKGEILKPIDIDLSEYHMAIVKPPFSISTAEAYGAIPPKKPKNPVSDIISEKIGNWKDILANDFQLPLEVLHPQLKMISSKLYEIGAVYASLSGSGSAYFAIFESIPSNFKSVFPDDYFTWSSQEY